MHSRAGKDHFPGHGPSSPAPPHPEAGRARLILCGLKLFRRLRRCPPASCRHDDRGEVLVPDPAALQAGRVAGAQITSRRRKKRASWRAMVPRSPWMPSRRTIVPRIARVPVSITSGTPRTMLAPAAGGDVLAGSVFRPPGRPEPGACPWRERCGPGKEVAPDLRRQVAAHDLVHGRVVVVADPDPDDQIGGEADEPGVPVFLGGAGLAACRPRSAAVPPSRFPPAPPPEGGRASSPGSRPGQPANSWPGRDG